MSTSRKVKGKRARPSASGNAGGTGGASGGGGASAQLEALILREVESVKPAALADSELVERLPVKVKAKERMEVVNKLLSSGRLELQHRRNDEGMQILMYKFVDALTARRLSGMDANERMVYQQIERSKGSGCTKRDLKYRTNIRSAGELNTYLNRLKERSLIKEINSTRDGPKKKVFLLEGIEPAAEHASGPWCEEGNAGGFDEEFVSAMYSVVYKFIANSSEAVSIDEITSFITQAKISVVPLTATDLMDLVRTMVYDGEIEETGAFDGSNSNGNGYGYGYTNDDANDATFKMPGHGAANSVVKYRRARPTPVLNQIATIPCGSCPVFNECAPDGVINPKSCIYMDNWLKAVVDW